VIVDTSAVIAILRQETEAQRCTQAIEDSDLCRMSAGSYLEAAVFIDAWGDAILSARLDDLIAEAGILIEPVTPEQSEIGRTAYRNFGKSSGHPAQLNYGDCFAYALAKVTREPLLFIGQDFSKTDVRPAI
jgi:ribonuclease VapC